MAEMSNTGGSGFTGGQMSNPYGSGIMGGKMDSMFSPVGPVSEESVKELAEQSGQEALAFYQGAMNPQGINNAGKIIVPANNRGIQTVVKPVTVYGNFAAIPGVSGALIWLTQNGALSVHMYRLFALGSPCPVAPTATSASFGLYNINAVLTQNLFIPMVPDEDVRLEPDIANTFTMGRTIAGSIRLKSDATSTTSAAMSGTASAGAINDTRTAGDFAAPVLAQQSVTKKDGIVDSKIQDGIVTLIGPDIAPDFTPLNWTRTYSTSRSAILIDILDGQVLSGQGTSNAQPYGSTGGPAAAWLSPYITLTRLVPNSNLILPIQKGQRDSVTPIGMEDSPEIWINCFVDLVKPALGTQQSPNVLDNLIKYPPVGYRIAGAVWVVHYFINNFTANGTTPTLNLVCEAERFEVSDSVSTQYWAGLIAGTPGAGTGQQPSTNPPLPGLAPTTSGGALQGVPMLNGANPISGSPTLTGAYYRIPQKFRSQPIRPAYTMWVGSLVQCSSTGNEYSLVSAQSGEAGGGILAALGNSSTGGADAHGFQNAAPLQTMVYPWNLPTYTSVVEISIIGGRVYEPGAIGPCRVIRFDNVAKGQNILVGGTLYVEAVPSGNIAPFYSNASNAVQSTQCNYVDLLALLCNGDNEHFKRVYTCSQYDYFVNNYLKILNQPISVLDKWSDLSRVVPELRKPEVIRAARAGGFFDAIREHVSHALPYVRTGLGMAAKAHEFLSGGEFESAGAIGYEYPQTSPGYQHLLEMKRSADSGRYPLQIELPESELTGVRHPEAYAYGQPSNWSAGGSLINLQGMEDWSHHADGPFGEECEDDEDGCQVHTLGSFGASEAVTASYDGKISGARIPAGSMVSTGPSDSASIGPHSVTVPTGFLMDPLRAFALLHKLYELTSHKKANEVKTFFGTYKDAYAEWKKKRPRNPYTGEQGLAADLTSLQKALDDLEKAKGQLEVPCIYTSRVVRVVPIAIVLRQPLKTAGESVYSLQVFFSPGGIGKVKTDFPAVRVPTKRQRGEKYDKVSYGVLFGGVEVAPTAAALAEFLARIGLLQAESRRSYLALKKESNSSDSEKDAARKNIQGVHAAMAKLYGAEHRPVDTYMRNRFVVPSEFWPGQGRAKKPEVLKYHQ